MKISDFILIQKKLTLITLKNAVQEIIWEIQGKSLYLFLLSMTYKFDIDFNKYLLLKNNA